MKKSIKDASLASLGLVPPSSRMRTKGGNSAKDNTRHRFEESLRVVTLSEVEAIELKSRVAHFQKFCITVLKVAVTAISPIRKETNDIVTIFFSHLFSGDVATL